MCTSMLQIAHFIVLPLLFCGLKLSVLVWVSSQLKRNPARLTKNTRRFVLITSFNLENVDPRSWQFSPERVLMRAYPYFKVCVSRSSGSRYSKMRICPLGRVMLRSSPMQWLVKRLCYMCIGCEIALDKSAVAFYTFRLLRAFQWPLHQMI